MALVRFNFEKEFMDELKQESPPGPVRISGLFKGSKLPIKHYYLIATYIDRQNHIVRLERYCGDIWNMPKDQEVHDKANEIRETLEALCAGMNIEVRGGVYEDAQT